MDTGPDVRGRQVRARLLKVVEASFPDDPALDTAVSRALLQRVAVGELPETLRLARPGRIVAFGKQDVIAPGYSRAVDAARGGGFEAIQRLAGGRAAVFHEGTLAFAHAVPDSDPKPGIQGRFALVAGIMVAAFRRLGVDARLGEVPGEYCPGGHSVNAAGRRKLMGVGQRLIAGGAHVGGVVVVDRPDLVNGILLPVYAALDLSFDPDATGSLAGEVEGLTPDHVRRAILEAYAARYELEPCALDEDTLALARSLAPEHLPSRAPNRVPRSDGNPRQARS